MNLKIEYSNIPLSYQKLDAIIVFIFKDSNLAGSGLNSLPTALKKFKSICLWLIIKQHEDTKGYDNEV